MEIRFLADKRLDQRVLNRQRSPRRHLPGDDFYGSIAYPLRIFLVRPISCPTTPLVDAQKQRDETILIAYSGGRHLWAPSGSEVSSGTRWQSDLSIGWPNTFMRIVASRRGRPPQIQALSEPHERTAMGDSE